MEQLTYDETVLLREALARVLIEKRSRIESFKKKKDVFAELIGIEEKEIESLKDLYSKLFDIASNLFKENRNVS